MVIANQKESVETLQPFYERVRFRCQSLKLDEKMEAVKTALFETKGVLQVECNKRVGSVLIIFDKTKLNAEQILGEIKNILDISLEKIKQSVHSTNTSLSSKKARTLVKRTLLATGILTISALYYSSDKHAFFGTIWLAAILLHAYQNRRTLVK